MQRLLWRRVTTGPGALLGLLRDNAGLIDRNLRFEHLVVRSGMLCADDGGGGGRQLIRHEGWRGNEMHLRTCLVLPGGDETSTRLPV